MVQGFQERSFAPIRNVAFYLACSLGGAVGLAGLWAVGLRRFALRRGSVFSANKQHAGSYPEENNSMQKMQRLIQSDSIDSPDFVGVVVAAMKEHLDADISFLSEFRHNLKVIRKLAGDGKAINTGEGSTFPLKDSYCHRMATGEIPNLVQDAHNDNRVNNLAFTKQFNVGTYVGVPVILPDGRTYGSLCCVYYHVETSIQPRDVRFMHVIAEILGNHFAAEETAIEDHRVKYDRIEKVIANQNMRMVFQPIVDISTRKIIGAEALARFDTEPRRTPDVWFAEGQDVGLGRELEIAAVQLALAQLHQFPQSTYLSVNVSPDTLQSAALFETLAMADPGRIVVEVTEHAVVKEYEPLMEAIQKLHTSGSRLAVDDVGAGYSGLGHIIRITPKIMKLDVSLTRNIYQDVVKQALATSAVAFASRVNIDIVAEGVETAEDALALQLLGVRYGQGYYYGKPGPLPLEIEIDRA